MRSWVSAWGQGLPRREGTQLGLESEAEFNQMKKEESACTNQEPGGPPAGAEWGC